MDEKWSFVQKKEAHCAPEESARRGDNWDHVAFDPEHRLVLSVVNGKRSHLHVRELSGRRQAHHGRQDTGFANDR